MLDLSDMERKVLLATQDGVPLEKEPFKKIAMDLDISRERVIEVFERLLDDDKVRRFGASLVHRKLGFSANAMIVWDVPDEVVSDVGKKVSGFDEVSHCYRRPRKKDWNYNLFAMVHGKSKGVCREIAEKISGEIEFDAYEILYSTEEFKKTGVRLSRR